MSAISRPSVNAPYTGARTCFASTLRCCLILSRAKLTAFLNSQNRAPCYNRPVASRVRARGTQAQSRGQAAWRAATAPHRHSRRHRRRAICDIRRNWPSRRCADLRFSAGGSLPLIQRKSCCSCLAVSVRGRPVALRERSARSPRPFPFASLSHL